MTNSRILIAFSQTTCLTILPVSSLDEAYVQAFLEKYDVRGMGGL